MTNNTMTMDSLEAMSVRVYPGTIAVNPVLKTEEKLDLSGIASKYNGYYATRNLTLCYVTDGKTYVIPYIRAIADFLHFVGFQLAYFFVPFSNGAYPKNDQKKWAALREEARQSYEKDFTEKCVAYCDKHHIGAISEKSLQKCFEIPADGFKVQRPNFDDYYLPTVENHSLFSAKREMGHFNENNGIVIFVYRNGKTYLAKDRKILFELNAAGFTIADYDVPLSRRDEKIEDDALRKLWESL